MRLTMFFCGFALCFAAAAPARSAQASGPIPGKAEVLRLDRTVEGSVTSADNRFGKLLFDCFDFTRPQDSPGMDLMLQSAGDRDLVVSLLEGHGCEVTQDSAFGLLAPGKGFRENIYGEMSLLVGAEAPADYRLDVAVAARNEGCIHRRGSRALQSGLIAFTTMNGKPELVPAVEHGGKWVLQAKSAYPAARGLDWYADDEPLAFGAATYVKYGLPRVLGFQEIEHFADKDGVFVGREKGSADTAPEVIYVLIDQAGCEFQPYQVDKD